MTSFARVRRTLAARRSQLMMLALAALAVGCSAARTPAADGMLAVPVEELPVVADRAWNTLASASPAAAVILWYLILSILGWAVWPFMAGLFPRAFDGGYSLAKGLGLLAVSYLLWIGASLRWWPNTAVSAWVITALLLLCAALYAWRRRQALADILRSRWRAVLTDELVFILIFTAFTILRMLNPDLWHPIYGGEKTMELGILNALSRSAYMPPYDPFLSGGLLNYYYFGHFICNTLLKLSGIAPEVGFNLCVPTFAALLGLQVFVLGGTLAPLLKQWDAAQPRFSAAGAFGALAGVLLLANLNVPIQLAAGLMQAGGASLDAAPSLAEVLRYIPQGIGSLLSGQARLPAFDYWNMATRIIPYTINEFPFFTYLFADLHPHLLTLPLTALLLNLLLTYLQHGSADDLRVGSFVLCALCLGALGPANTWDLPTYAIITAAVLIFAQRSRGKRWLRRGAGQTAVVFALAELLYLPYYRNVQAQDFSLAWVAPGASSPVATWLVVWGWQLYLSITLLAVEWRRISIRPRLKRLWLRYGWQRGIKRWLRLGGASPARTLCIGIIGLGALAAAVWLGLRNGPLLLIVTPLAAASLALLLLPANDPGEFCRRLLLAAGWLILWGIEIIYLKDFLSGSDWRRMNTLFKFGLQAWVLLGLALGSWLPALWKHFKRSRAGVLWKVGAALLGATALLYIPLAVPARINERFSAPLPALTLDGSAFMQTAQYNWPDGGSEIDLSYDREALVWLNQHVAGTPALAEAPLGYYREFGTRIAAYTGLPTLTGLHASEQHPWQVVQEREQAAAALYGATSEERFWEIVRQYNVRYIYLGQLERIAYPGEGLDKFARLERSGQLELVYANARTSIYRVPYAGSQ